MQTWGKRVKMSTEFCGKIQNLSVMVSVCIYILVQYLAPLSPNETVFCVLLGNMVNVVHSNAICTSSVAAKLALNIHEYKQKVKSQ